MRPMTHLRFQKGVRPYECAGEGNGTGSGPKAKHDHGPRIPLSGEPLLHYMSVQVACWGAPNDARELSQNYTLRKDCQSIQMPAILRSCWPAFERHQLDGQFICVQVRSMLRVVS